MSAIKLSTSSSGSISLSPADTASNFTITVPAVSGTMFNQGNIVGTVSESSGVPTGAIIEQGNNANGRFVKYADGTMICYASGLESRSASGSLATAVTLPATFINQSLNTANQIYAPFVTLNTAVPETATSSSASTLTTTSLNVRIVRSNATNTQFSVMVVGRWF
jgi:hypothetical protein